MKKKFISLMLFGLLCTGQMHAQYFPVDTLKLNSAFRELQNKPNTPERQKAFFDAFPRNWNEYIMLFQYYSDKKYDSSMSRLSGEYVDTFEHKLTLIKDSAYCTKTVSLALGALLDADAPNALRDLQHFVMWKKMETMMKVISGLTDADQMLYWQFYWSSPFKKEKMVTEYNRLHKLLADRHPKEMKTMEIAFNYFCGKALFQSDNHIGGRHFVNEK